MSATAPRPEPIAAPPDDGGHQGSFSRPDDQLQVNPPDGSRHPELSRDPAHPAPSRRGATVTTWAIVVLLFAGIVLWHYCGSAQPKGALGSATPPTDRAHLQESRSPAQRPP